MAIPLETLVIQIAADIGDLKNKMAVAQRTTSDTVAKTNSALRASIGTWAKWAAAAIGAWKAVGAITAQFRIVDEIAKTSDALNIATESLVAFQFAGKLAGVEISQLKTGIGYMTRNIGEAARGTGEAKDALEDLGLNVNALVRMRPDEQFEAIAEAMTTVGTASERASITMDIFGRSGLRMINLLQGGKEELDRARRAVEEYGTALTRIEMKKIEAVNNAVVEMGEAWTGLVRQLMVGAAPALIRAINTMTNSVDVFRLAWYGLQRAINTVSGAIVTAIGWATTQVVRGLNLVIEGINQLIKGAKRVEREWDTLTGKLTAKRIGPGKGAGRQAQAEAGITALAMFDVDALRDNFAEATGLVDETNKIIDEKIAEISARMTRRHMDWAKEAAELEKELREEEIQAAIDAEQAKVKAAEDASKQIIAIDDETKRQRIQNAWDTANFAVSSAINSLQLIGSTMEAESREQFQLTKALGIAETIVNTSVAVMNIWARIKNPWAFGTLTALAVAAGAAQIAKIQATQFGGGGAAPAPTGAPTSATAGAATGGEGGGGGATQAVDITIVGDVFSGGGLRNFIERLNEELGDGAQLNVRTD